MKKLLTIAIVFLSFIFSGCSGESETKVPIGILGLEMGESMQQVKEKLDEQGVDYSSSIFKNTITCDSKFEWANIPWICLNCEFGSNGLERFEMTSLGTISVSEAMCLFQALTEEGFSYPVPDGRNENMFIMHNGDYEATVGITRSYTMCFVYNKRKDDERTRN